MAHITSTVLLATLTFFMVATFTTQFGEVFFTENVKNGVDPKQFDNLDKISYEFKKIKQNISKYLPGSSSGISIVDFVDENSEFVETETETITEPVDPEQTQEVEPETNSEQEQITEEITEEESQQEVEVETQSEQEAEVDQDQENEQDQIPEPVVIPEEHETEQIPTIVIPTQEPEHEQIPEQENEQPQGEQKEENKPEQVPDPQPNQKEEDQKQLKIKQLKKKLIEIAKPINAFGFSIKSFFIKTVPKKFKEYGRSVNAFGFSVKTFLIKTIPEKWNEFKQSESGKQFVQTKEKAVGEMQNQMKKFFELKPMKTVEEKCGPQCVIALLSLFIILAFVIVIIMMKSICFIFHHLI